MTKRVSWSAPRCLLSSLQVQQDRLKYFLKSEFKIISGAAVIFLQLCILATCLLCLYSNRRSKKRSLSRAESLHSSDTMSSAHPTLHTLYHDQLTFRPATALSSSVVSGPRVTEHSLNTLKSLRTTLRD